MDTEALNAPRRTPAGVTDPAVRLHSRVGTFYGLSIGVPWSLWLLAGWLSRQPEQTPLTTGLITVLALLGLLAPMFVAAALIFRVPSLRQDTLNRLTLRGVRRVYFLLAATLLPAALLVATCISLMFGYPLSQFQFSGLHSFMIGSVPGWVALGLAPLVEELAWHSYGTDALAARWSIWRTSIVFAVFWALWHIPLASIRGTYQAQVSDVGVLASINFLVSIVPFIILMNWLYYRANRNIWVAVVFHLFANYGNELLRTSPDTKAIQTLVLSVLCAWVLWHDRALFFTRPEAS